jgi:orotidine-5'-phosphate decarboxylase
VNYADRLAAAIARCGNPCLIGLDPHVDLLPDAFAVARDPKAPRRARAQALGDFCCEIVELCRGRVPAVKPQSAFFEVFGADGAQQWERVVAAAHAAGLLVIGDVKRGDIASTAAAYATAFLEGVGDRPETLCDAVTLSPFLGADSIEPFLSVCQRTGTGIYVLVRTSNKGSADFQRHGQPELSLLIADKLVEWGRALTGASGWSSAGAVVGATHAAELRTFRARMPNTPLLLPGYGAQGAGAADIVDAFRAADGTTQLAGALVNSSRGVLFAHRDAAHRGKTWKDASRDALEHMIADIAGALERAASVAK